MTCSDSKSRLTDKVYWIVWWPDTLTLSIAGVIIQEILEPPWDISSIFIALTLGAFGFVAAFTTKRASHLSS